MTPRDIDVAYVLEGHPGVFGVYAVRGPGPFRYAVHLDTGGHAIAKMHYALLRVLTHEECASVALYQVEIPSVIRASATRLVLSPEARAAARARVPLTTPALEQTLAAAEAPARGSVLIIDDEPGIAAIAQEAFGPESRRDIIADPFAALWEAKMRQYDLILCDVNRAYGDRGFVSNLAVSERKRAHRVVLLAWPHELSTLDEPWFTRGVVYRPVTAESLRAAARRATGKTVASSSHPRPRMKPRVLVIDDTAVPASVSAFTLVAARNAWEALERIHEDWALVICNLTMKTDTGARLYSLLWKTRPEIKHRFVFLVDQPDDANRVLTRPLTDASVASMLEQVTDARSSGSK